MTIFQLPDRTLGDRGPPLRCKRSRAKNKGEVHASWVLEGRAIQDLFIFPGRADRHTRLPAQGDRYATTIRTYDRGLKAWRVNIINPATYETSANLIARRQGDGIEMEGRLDDETPIRWRYEKITPTSFKL